MIDVRIQPILLIFFVLNVFFSSGILWLSDESIVDMFATMSTYFGKNVKIVHFIGAVKPWNASFDQNGDPVRPGYLKHWWHIHDTEVMPRIEHKVDGTIPQT